MKHYLDPVNEAFAQAIAGMPSPHVLGPEKAYEALEELQKHDPASDIEAQAIKVAGEDGVVTDVVIFKSKAAVAPCHMVFYYHGGGWIMGSPASFAPLLEDLARRTGAAIIFPCYTTAPKRLFPFQYEQLYTVLEYFVRNGHEHNLSAESIVLAGDSVGGHMSIAMMHMLIERKLQVNIGHMVLFYPVTLTDNHDEMPSYKVFQDGPFLPAATMDWMIETCIPDKKDRETPLASPLHFLADEILAKFPPTTIILSTVDPLLDEGIAFGRRLQQVGVNTAIIKAEGQMHAFILVKPLRQSATAQAMIELAASKMRQTFLPNQHWR